MDRTVISDQEAEALQKKLKILWVIKRSYWYPLFASKRKDVIAFKTEFIEEDEENKITDLQEFLFNNNELKIYEKEEDGSVYITETSTFAPYGSETFWFGQKMDWIIYASHEGSITFGGKLLIQFIKERWKDWKAYLY